MGWGSGDPEAAAPGVKGLWPSPVGSKPQLAKTLCCPSMGERETVPSAGYWGCHLWSKVSQCKDS